MGSTTAPVPLGGNIVWPVPQNSLTSAASEPPERGLACCHRLANETNPDPVPYFAALGGATSGARVV